jgi:gliding motility-associated lipoprotein GldD
MKIIYTLPLICCLFLHSCSDEEITIPKPSTYLYSKFNEHNFSEINSNCPYSFEISSHFKLQNVYYGKEITCHKDIDLGKLNGTIHFSYIEMNKPVSEYINFSIDKVDEHKIKATAIEDSKIIRTKDKVYGTLFEIQGDVASPYQFYLTDSTKHFVSGVLYLNSKPNYDSLKPTLDYLKFELNHLVQTFKWK